MYSYPEDVDEDLPNEIVEALNAREASHPADDDDLIYSDAVQDAFKKYQNEVMPIFFCWPLSFLRYLQQDEMFAQMEECWNYMNQETDRASMPNTTVKFSRTIARSTEIIVVVVVVQVRGSQAKQLNPDATEFQPTWSTPNATNAHQGFLPSSRSAGHGAKK